MKAELLFGKFPLFEKSVEAGMGVAGFFYPYIPSLWSLTIPKRYMWLARKLNCNIYLLAMQIFCIGVNHLDSGFLMWATISCTFLNRNHNTIIKIGWRRNMDNLVIFSCVNFSGEMSLLKIDHDRRRSGVGFEGRLVF